MPFNPDVTLKDFPCSFNLIPGNQVSRQRLKHVEHNVKSDLDTNCSGEEEIIRNKNLLSWVLFCLDKKQDAGKLNEEVLTLTQRRNIVALGNLIFISCRRGWERKAEDDFFEELQDLQKDENFDKLRLNALAEQAYSYSRIGGLVNSKLGLALFQECTEKCPENYIWKFGLGLFYRRLTNVNFHCSSPEKLNLQEMAGKCARLLLEVGEKGDDRFKGLAYAQLVNLKQNLKGKEYNHLFNYLNMWKLKDKALQFGGDNPTVLTLCGKSFKSVNIDESITLLKRSLALRENGIAYHHLGLSLVRKADMIASGKYLHKSLSESGPDLHRSARRRLSLDSAAPETYPNASFQQMTCAPPMRSHNVRNRFQFSSQCGHPVGLNRYEQLVGNEKSGSENRNWHKSTDYRQRQSTRDSNYDFYHRGNYHQVNSSKRYTPKTVDSCEISRQTPTNYDEREFHHQDSQRTVSGSFRTPKKNEMRTENRGTQRPYVQKSISSPESNSPYTNDALKSYARSPIQKIDKDNELLIEAIACYEKCIHVTREQNVPAILSLGDAYFKSEQYDEALAQYNQVIAHAEGSYILTLISAYEFAGICLQNLSKLSSEPEKRRQQAKEHFTKAISLAADMVSRNPNFQDCETEVWESLKILRKDVESIPDSKQKTKETLKLLELVRKYSDIVEVANKMKDEVLDDVESFQTLLNSYLIIADYEQALVCLNMASMKSRLVNSKLWPSRGVVEIKARTYIAVGWSRLIESSPDCRRVVQQLFQLKYGQCAGMNEGNNENDLQTDGRDILVVNDETADSESGPDITTTLACNLSQILNVVFGADTFRNLTANADFSHGVEETQLQEMKNYKLVLLILGENDSPRYDRMLESVHLLKDPKFMVLNLRQTKDVPEILKSHKFLDVDNVIRNQTKLLSTSRQGTDCPEGEDEDWSVSDVMDKLMDGKPEAAMRLFCSLVEEDFEKHREHLKPLVEKSRCKPAVAENCDENEESKSSAEDLLKGIIKLKI